MPNRISKCLRGLPQGGRLLKAIWQHPANRPNRLGALLAFFRWQFLKHALKRPTTIDFHRLKLKCFPDSAPTSAAIYFNGLADYWEMKFLQAYLRPGDNFLDIGANTGVYTVLAASRIGPQGCIDAFEPVERTAQRIEEQATLNHLDHVRVHRFAVSDRNGTLNFGFSGSDAMMHVQRAGEPASEGAQVSCVRLDDFQPYEDYAAAKMDIEGAEPFALAGATHRLQQVNPPVWLIELAGYSTCYGVSSDEIIERLSAAGFDCAIFNPATHRLEYTQTPWLMGVQNVLAIARTRRSFVEDRLQAACSSLQ